MRLDELHNCATLRQAPFLTLFAIVLFVGLNAYAVLHGTGGSSIANDANLPRDALGPSAFTSPMEGASVANPVRPDGHRRDPPQTAGEPVQAGYGHPA